MLDIRFIRDNPDLVREAARKKHIDFHVNELLAVDERRRLLIHDVEALRAEMNTASSAIAIMEGTEARADAITKSRTVKKSLEVKEGELNEAEEKFRALMLDVPNIPDPSVPEGNSDADNVEIRRWGEPRVFNETMKDHVALMHDLDLVDTERGAKVSGTRGYFLKNEGLILSMALWRFAIDHMSKKGFTPISAPVIVRGRNLLGTGHFPQQKEDVYAVGDDEFLAGTAEIGLMGLYADEILQEDELPKQYVGFSPCFRKEAGSYGKDTKGIYRIHEFFKVEQLVLIRSDHQESVRWHEELTANSEELLQAIEIPYRVVVNCSGDIGRAHVKTYDIESWIPSENRYRESHSSSYYHDFQTRRLGIRYRDASGEIRFAHSLNNTVIATPRILIALLENHQQEDGSVKIPDALVPYVGKERIAPR